MDFNRTRDRLGYHKTMPRALKNLDINLGLAVIPVQLLIATSSGGCPRSNQPAGVAPRSLLAASVTYTKEPCPHDGLF